ncbi:MAG: hypothetical protein NTV51_18800 [Verrucomicrobia bacterium]|nr:hypothetical protein [Verrucomicrobiota bacterium]
MNSPGPTAPPPTISWRHRLLTRYDRTGEHPGRLRVIGGFKRLLAVKTLHVEVVPGVFMELDEGGYGQREPLTKGGYALASLKLFDRLAAAAAPNGLAIHVSVRPVADVLPLVPPTAFDLVQIDVEGYEARVLASLFSAFAYGLPETLPVWPERQGCRLRTVTGEPFAPGSPLPEDNLWAELRT